MPHLATYLGLADRSERTLAESFRAVADGHAQVADVYHTCRTLAGWSDAHRQRLAAATVAVEHPPSVVEHPSVVELVETTPLGLAQAREGEIGLLRDLQDLHVLATLVQTTWTVLVQVAQALRDRELLEIAQACNAETSRQLSWLNTRIKAAAPQALIVAP